MQAATLIMKSVDGWLVNTAVTPLHGTPFIVIDTILPAIHTEQGAAHLTFTGDTQIALHNHLEEHFPDKVFLGWYHTHPRMGVFFSHWDAWLHQNFFPEAWQVALVIEPHQFSWRIFYPPGGWQPGPTFLLWLL